MWLALFLRSLHSRGGVVTQNLSNLIGVTHKSSKSLQNVVRFFFFFNLGMLNRNPKHFRRLRPDLKFCKNYFIMIFDWLSLFFDRSSFIEFQFFFLQLEST